MDSPISDDLGSPDEFFERLRERVLPYFEDGYGHGIDHAERVYRLALKISEDEDVDLDVVRVAALLHDVARAKETKGNSVCYGGDVCHAEEGAKMSREILEEMGFSSEKIDSVAHAILAHRTSGGIEPESREAEIVQDADRLEALGATIMVRMIEAAMKNGEPIYDPSIIVKAEYDGEILSVVSHIYEKLLKMTPDSFWTEKGREIARGRYDFIKEFAERYVGEFEGGCDVYRHHIVLRRSFPQENLERCRAEAFLF